MINYHDVVNEILACNNMDKIRTKYLQEIQKHRKRNVIAYYSGWQTGKQGHPFSIGDIDTNGFVNALAGLDKEKGLDLILHTPGGDPTATEGIVKYLRDNFTDINIIIPHMAMSAGTMLACSSNLILMAGHSYIGPVDPQFNGIPAYDIKKEFDNAKKEMVKNPSSAPYWNQMLNKYPPAFYNIVNDAIELSSELIKEWLKKYMMPGKTTNVEKIVKKLNSNNKSHAKHFCFKECEDMGLIVKRLEDDPKLYDLVMALHYAYTFTFSNANVGKIIENAQGKMYVL